MQKTKKILITGSNGAIGSSLCKKFKDQDWYVIGIDKHKKSIIKVDHYESINFLNIHEKKTRLYLQNFSKNFFREGLDCLINNAALQIIKPFEKLTFDDFKDTFSVNFDAPFFLAQTFINELIQKKGNIINISSIHSTQTKANFAAYSTSKSALDGLTRALVVEFADKIKINGISPAAINTKMLVKGFEKNPANLKKLKEYHPSNSIGEPSLISDVAYFLASVNDPFLNGSIIDITGGISSRLHDPL